MANWGEFFSRLGEGLINYGSYSASKRRDEEDREQSQAELALRRAGLEDDRKYRSDTLAAQERDRLRQSAENQTDRLFKAGVVAPQSYGQDVMKAGLPQTGGQDVAGMAINATRQYGQARVDDFQGSIPQAQNELYRSGELSKPLPGGGQVFMDPGTRANLDIAQGNAEIARQNRLNAHQIALIRANAAGGKRADPVEMKRLSFMQKTIADKMKPQMDPVTGLVTAPGMKQGEAYKAAAAEWTLIKNQPTLPADSVDQENPDQEDTPDFDPAAVAAELEGLDAETARSVLESMSYTEEEIQQVLGD